MDQRQQQQLDKLLEKSRREVGLDRIDHRELPRLIAQADAEDKLLTRSALPGKAIITSGSGELPTAPRSWEKVGEVNR